MSQMVKIAEPDELPPGKGKTIHVSGRDITVYNQEGRYVATSTAPRTMHPADALTTTCDMPGHQFTIGHGDSPDRLRADELNYQVHATAQGIFVLIEEGRVHAGDEPRRKPRASRRRPA